MLLTYDFPLNEKMRTMLRIEHQLQQVDYLAEQSDSIAHHLAIIGLLQFLDIVARGDVRTEIIQTLEHQRQILLRLRNEPNIDTSMLKNAIKSIDTITKALASTKERAGQHLREDEWLMQIKTRAHLPGGLSEFDNPSYHNWLNQPNEQRNQQLTVWLTPLNELKQAIHLVLKMSRNSAHPYERAIANNGSLSLQSTSEDISMLRLELDTNLCVVPEVSANRYAINIRFLFNHLKARPELVKKDVPFNIGYCTL